MDPKLRKKIAYLKKNCQQMPLMAVIGLIIPVAYLIAIPIGILYYFQSKKLLQQIESGEISIDWKSMSRGEKMDIEDDLNLLRDSPHNFFFPTIVLVLGIVVIGILILVMG